MTIQIGMFTQRGIKSVKAKITDLRDGAQHHFSLPPGERILGIAHLEYKDGSDGVVFATTIGVFLCKEGHTKKASSELPPWYTREQKG